MPLFICEECQSIENTSTGRWWARNSPRMWAKGDEKRALCSVCAPTKYADGTPTKYGKWHDRFPRNRAAEADLNRVINPGVFKPDPSKSEGSVPEPAP